MNLKADTFSALKDWRRKIIDNINIARKRHNRILLVSMPQGG